MCNNNLNFKEIPKNYNIFEKCIQLNDSKNQIM
jgi:hypothetical protein